jgi:hypothetical protein
MKYGYALAAEILFNFGFEQRGSRAEERGVDLAGCCWALASAGVPSLRFENTFRRDSPWWGHPYWMGSFDKKGYQRRIDALLLMAAMEGEI